MEQTQLALIGAGNWGRNYLRNFKQIENASLKWVFDPDPLAMERSKMIAPEVRQTTEIKQILSDSEVKGVIIASPPNKHYTQAVQALNAGKHVLVEKPITTQYDHATKLCQLADQYKLTLMVGHLLLFHPAVRFLKKQIQNQKIGDLFTITSNRLNLGKIRQDTNVIWSFAPHDLSVILHFVDKPLISLSARGQSYLNPPIIDIANIHLQFAEQITANIQLSWVHPSKERLMTIVGSEKLAVFDDHKPTEKICLVEKGAHQPPEFDSFDQFLTLGNGTITIPKLDLYEPLAEQCKHFVQCIRDNRPPLTTGKQAAFIAKILEATELSIANSGEPQFF